MKTEYEIRILEIDIDRVTNTLELLGAKKVGEYFQKRYVYDLNPVQNGKWIRLRTNGIKTTLTYKDIVSNTIDGTPHWRARHSACARADGLYQLRTHRREECSDAK